MPVYTDKKSGRLFIQFDYKGKTYKKYLLPDTAKSDARKIEIKWKNDLLFESFGIYRKKDVLYEDFLTQTFLPFAKDHYSPDGYKNSLVILKASLKFLKGISLRRITPADIEKFRNSRQRLLTKHGTPRKPATIHRELNVLSKAFSYAVKLDYLDFNPCGKVDRPVISTVEDKVLPIDKTQEFLQNIHSAWARAVAVLILNTGLRQNDALGLKKSEADFDNKEIRLIQGKSGREVKIPMNSVVFELLSARKNNGSDLFFPSPRTKKQGKSIKKALLAAGERTKIGKIGTRVLRRTYGTNLEESKHPTATTAKLLGHSDLRSVHRYQRGKQVLKDAVEAVKIVNPTPILRASKKKKS